MNKMVVRSCAIALMGICLVGCAAMLVPETSDPAKKIAYAIMLFDEQQRPLPAERLIREAIAVYKENNEELVLAEAYRAYGFFFMSKGVERSKNYYESSGFMDEKATYAGRYDKSVEYFDKAAVIQQKYGAYDKLTNIHLNMGFAHEFAGRPEEACEEYNKSLVSNQEYRRANPDVELTLPEGVSSFEEYITAFLVRLNCAAPAK